MRSFLIVFMALFSHLGLGQNTKQFFDAYGKRGEIIAASPILDSILPKSGAYELRWRTIDSTVLHTSFAKGRLRNHLPDGFWTWEEASWAYTIIPGTSIRPNFTSEGLRTRWQVNFKNGLPSGKYTVVTDSVFSDGKTSEPLMKFEVNLMNGVPIGEFIVEQKIGSMTYRFQGSLNAQGIAHGKWSFGYMENRKLSVREEHIYNNGLLTSAWELLDEERVITSFQTNLDFLDKKLYAETHLGLHRFQRPEYVSPNSLNTANLFQQFFTNGWKHPEFQFDLALISPAFLQLEFPLSEKELALKNQSLERLNALQEELSQMMSLNLIIIRNRGEDYDLAVSYIERTARRLRIIDSLLARTDLPLFTYKKRHELGLAKWCELIDTDLEVNGKVYPESTVRLPSIGELSVHDNIFDRINQIIVVSEEEVQLRVQKILEAESEIQKEGELKDLENKLVDAYENLQELYQNERGIAAFIAQKWVRDDLDKMIQAYANAQNYEQALLLADQLNNRMDSLALMHDFSVTMDSMVLLLDQHYRYMDYNPFSGIYDIEVRVKRRFLTNVFELLLPMMFEELRNAQDWDSFAFLWDRQRRTYDFLLAFAFLEDKQSNRINKRVRKEKKAERIWKILEPLVYEEK